MIVKRAFDIVVSASVLVPGLPIIGLLAIAIRMETPGPAIFRQERIGRNGVPFVCLKLRTMRKDTPNAPTHETGAAGVTGLGRGLRRFKLDELPQLFNVLKGEMSLVGPRPCLPMQMELIAERRRLGVLSLRPGITGPAQVAGIDMSDPVKLARADAAYLNRRGLVDDLVLLLRTFSRSALRDRTIAP